MTNGEKIKVMFPSMEVGFITVSQVGIYFVKNQHNATVFSLDWWNTEYKEPTTKNDLGTDAVSRAEVIKIFDEWFATCNIADRKASPKAKINALPSATPIRPTKGNWIKEKSIYGWDGYSYQCSVCGRSVHLDTAVEDINLDYPYCHCGVKMEGVEE